MDQKVIFPKLCRIYYSYTECYHKLRIIYKEKLEIGKVSPAYVPLPYRNHFLFFCPTFFYENTFLLVGRSLNKDVPAKSLLYNHSKTHIN